MTEQDAATAGRWTQEQAWDWSRSRPWHCGFNYLPSVAVNFVDTWLEGSFAPDVIARELAWAQHIGYNTLRINLPFVIWENDGAGLIDRIDRFLDIAHHRDLDVILCLFDDCEFSGEPAAYGPQPDPVPGVHNSRAVGSPGRAVVSGGGRRSDLKAYVQSVIGRFADDGRVLLWDLYNEPGNRMIFRAGRYEAYSERLTSASQDLMLDAFRWAREVAPRQPLSVAAWSVPKQGEACYGTEIDQLALAMSDVVTFHAYVPSARLESLIRQISGYGRPAICTEWMARSLGSRIDDQLNMFRDKGVGAIQWGFVRGRTQTHLPWPDGVAGSPGVASSDEWFHDLLDEKGRPYSEQEVGMLRRLLRT